MSNEPLLSRLRRAADEHHIEFRLRTDKWPASHCSTFKDIVDAGNHEFDSYKESVGHNSDDFLWKRKTIARAEWLAKESGRRSLARANEMTWRLAIEDVVLERFRFEVACPNCNHRLWRSDVESDPNSAFGVGSSRCRAWTKQVMEHRVSRQTCICPRTERILDYFEAGTSRLFDDIADQEFIPDDAINGVPRLKPDRTIGLRATTNIEELLQHPFHSRFNDEGVRLGSKIRTNPFLWLPEPMVFPFLILEAKSESTQSSFTDIQTQSAFPIRSLLELQRELHSIQGDTAERPAPLVWLFGNTGSIWKVYGCYLSIDIRNQTHYNIHQLWAGDIMDRNTSLQLLLVVDQINDWARTVFRPSIITELRSLTTGKDLDEETLGPDPDLASRAGNIVDWITRQAEFAEEDLNTDSLLNDVATSENVDVPRVINWHENAIGCVRPLSTIKRHFGGLLLSEHNMACLLILGNGTETVGSFSQSQVYARKLATLFSRWAQVLVVTAADLYKAEQLWTDTEIDEHRLASQELETEYYAVFEYKAELHGNFHKSAAYEKKHPIDVFPKSAKRCQGPILAEAITCILSGSRSEVVHSAFANTVGTFAPVEEHPQNELSGTVRLLTLGYQTSDYISPGIKEFLLMASRLPPKRMHDSRGPKLKDTTDGDTVLAMWEALTADRSFRRFSQRTIHVDNDHHLVSQCVRCEKGIPDMFAGRSWCQTESPSLNVYGAILAASTRSQGRSVCLFVDERSFWLDTETAVAVIVEDLLQSGFVCHVVSTESEKRFHDSDRINITWNLPFVYRKCTVAQHWTVSRWIQLLSGQPLGEEQSPQPELEPSEEEQMMLHLFRRGMEPDDAQAFIWLWIERSRIRGFRYLSLWRFRDDLKRQNGEPTPNPTYLWLPRTLHLEGDL